ncbi:MAG: hypothetical protein ACU836_06025 [Gammaproteobacteria bacterium]
MFGNRNRDGYAIFKATLNMLGRLWSYEFTSTHIAAITSGLIESNDEIHRYPSEQRSISAGGTHSKSAGGWQSAIAATGSDERILQALPQFKGYQTGSYIEIGQIAVPKEYTELMRARSVPGNN